MAVQTKQIEHLFNEGHSLPDLLPYLEYTDDVFVLCDGSLGKIWKVDLCEAEGKTDTDLMALVNQWESLLTRIPTDRLAAQIILVNDHNVDEQLNRYLEYREETGYGEFAQGKNDHIRACSEGFFTYKSERFIPKRLRLYLTLRYFPAWVHPDIWRSVVKTPGTHILEEMRRHHNEFLKYVGLIDGILHSIGVHFECLNAEQLAGWLYHLLNPKRSRLMPRINFYEDKTIREQVLYHVPQATGQGFVLEDQPTRVVSLKELPLTTTPAMFTREFYEGAKFCLLDLPQDFMLVMNFTVAGTNESLERLNRQKSFAFMHQDNWLGDKSIEATEKKKELDETIAHMFKGGGKVVQARVHWVIQASNEEDADMSCNHLLSRLNRLNCEGLKEELIGASLFLTCLPLNFDPYYERFIRRGRRLISGNAADMLPVFGSFRGTNTPAQIYCNRRGELVNLDFFDSNINPHAVVIGASGAGKSFFINDFILQNDRLGAHFFVLDKGDSYKKLSSILGGEYMTFDLNHPLTINPFANPPTPENLSFLLSLLSQMASGGDERDRLTREEEGLLYRAVSKSYEQNKHGAEVTLSNVTEILNSNAFNEQFGINSVMGPTLALRLTPFTKRGPYGEFFDGPNRFKTDKRFTVFELAGLSAYPDLQTIVLLNLMFFMTNFVASAELKSKRKYLLIDEAWSLFRVKNTADFITNAFKTFRKFRCSVVAITQEMADLTRQESGMAIIANASNKIFLKQEASVVDLLKDKLSADEGTIKALKTLETVKGKFSEAFVMSDGSCGIIRLVPDPFLYWVANSEPRNNEYLFKQARSCGGNLIEALKICAKEHPYGI